MLDYRFSGKAITSRNSIRRQKTYELCDGKYIDFSTQDHLVTVRSIDLDGIEGAIIPNSDDIKAQKRFALMRYNDINTIMYEKSILIKASWPQNKALLWYHEDNKVTDVTQIRNIRDVFSVHDDKLFGWDMFGGINMINAKTGVIEHNMKYTDLGDSLIKSKMFKIGDDFVFIVSTEIQHTSSFKGLKVVSFTTGQVLASIENVEVHDAFVVNGAVIYSSTNGDIYSTYLGNGETYLLDIGYSYVDDVKIDYDDGETALFSGFYFRDFGTVSSHIPPINIEYVSDDITSIWIRFGPHRAETEIELLNFTYYSHPIKSSRKI